MMGSMSASRNPSRSAAVGFTLASAALFGLATPAVKAHLGETTPQLAAGVLYLGMGLGLGVAYAAGQARQAPLNRSEVVWLAVSVVCGGIIAPWLIFWGLQHSTATTTSLLANTEVVFSTLIARFCFGERYSSRLFLGVALILAGAVALNGFGASAIEIMPGLAVIAACAFWGIDNNAMRKVAHAEASFVGSIKGLVAGTTNLMLAAAVGNCSGSAMPLVWIGLVGIVCYGMSFGLYVRGLRVLGAARTSAYFGTAPFTGAIASILVLGEPVNPLLGVAAALMGVGVWLHLTDPHPPLGPHTAGSNDGGNGL
jgi:drug/metabolite transporter (DMT)-like permease